MLADTQATHSIGGFKMGVGLSLRKHRNCLAVKETMSIRVCKWSVETVRFLGYSPDEVSTPKIQLCLNTKF